MDEFNFEDEGNLSPEETEKLNETIEALSNVSRKVGLYLERAILTELPGPGGFPRRALMANFTLGDIAFAARVQDPEQDTINKQFDEMTTEMTNDEFLDTRARMKRNIEAGRDPLDDGEFE